MASATAVLVLLASFALAQNACQSSRRESQREAGGPEKGLAQDDKAEPVASAVGVEDSLRGAFRPVMSIQELDGAVSEALARRIGPMAAAGEPYQATDVVLDDLPWRRFVVAGVSAQSPDIWLVCYEHGGIGHHHHLILFELENGVASVKKSGQWLPGRARPVTLERAVEALRNDEQKMDNHW